MSRVSTPLLLFQSPFPSQDSTLQTTSEKEHHHQTLNMQSKSFLAIVLAFITFAAASPIATPDEVEARQLNQLLCPLLGTGLCSVQCQLRVQTTGLCAPDRYVENCPTACGYNAGGLTVSQEMLLRRRSWNYHCLNSWPVYVGS